MNGARKVKLDGAAHALVVQVGGLRELVDVAELDTLARIAGLEQLERRRLSELLGDRDLGTQAGAAYFVAQLASLRLIATFAGVDLTPQLRHWGHQLGGLEPLEQLKGLAQLIADELRPRGKLIAEAVAAAEGLSVVIEGKRDGETKAGAG